MKLVLYANPTRPTSVGVIKTILDQFLSQVEIGRVGGNVMVSQLITSGLIQPQQAAKIGQTVGASQGAIPNPNISLNNITAAGKAVKLDVLAILAPGMALMFLMYTTSNGGRSLLAERAMGTLPRLLITPTSVIQVVGGKIFGIYLTGVLQMLILVGGCTLLFQLDWGDPLGVVALVLSAVAGAVGWGLIITAVARTPGQVGAIGSATMLTFGILGGTFLNLETLPAWFRVISHISPNAWGVDGFNILAQGGGLVDITGQLAGLWIMGAVLFAVAVLLLRRRGFAQA
jgi:ABC-2 type transport system permease protein